MAYLIALFRNFTNMKYQNKEEGFICLAKTNLKNILKTKMVFYPKNNVMQNRIWFNKLIMSPTHHPFYTSGLLLSISSAILMLTPKN